MARPTSKNTLRVVRDASIIIKKLSNKEETVKSISKKYNVSPQTVYSVLKEKGYEFRGSLGKETVIVKSAKVNDASKKVVAKKTNSAEVAAETTTKVLTKDHFESREALRKHVYELSKTGMTQTEIGEQLGITQPKVSKLIREEKVNCVKKNSCAENNTAPILISPKVLRSIKARREEIVRHSLKAFDAEIENVETFKKALEHIFNNVI